MSDSNALDCYRFPLSPGPALGSGWKTVLVTPESRAEVSYLAADPGDGLWTAGLAIRKYSFATRSFEIIFDLRTLTIAPVSATMCWAVAFDTEETYVVRASEEDGIERMPPLPRDEFPYIITAAPDGTVWVRAIGKAVFLLQPDGAGWEEIAMDGIDVETISAASRNSVWLLGRKGKQTAIWRYDPERKGWIVCLSLPGDHKYGLVACADETVWLVCIKAGVSTVSQLVDGSWIPIVEDTGMSLDMQGRLAAGSANRLYTKSRVRDLFGEFVAYSVGVPERFATPWPFQTQEEQAAYEHISRQLGIVGLAGVRGEYDNRNQPFDSWRVDIHRMERPPEIAEAGWDATVDLLLDELESVIAVNNLFRNLRDLNTQIAVVNATILPGVEETVGLSHESPVDEQRWIELAYGAMFNGALRAIYGALPPPYNTVAGIVSAGIFAAIGDCTHSEGSDPDAKLKLKFSELTRETAELFLRSNEANDRAQHRILKDCGRLNLAGKAIRSGIWSWPTQQSTEIARLTSAAFELCFYKSLVPARWQVVWWKKWWVNNTLQPPYPIRIKAPKHAALWECQGDPMQHMLCDVWVCNGLGAGTHAANSLEPFPSEALMNYLFNELKANREDFFRVEDGWSLCSIQGAPSTSTLHSERAILEGIGRDWLGAKEEVPSAAAQFLAASERRRI